MKLSNSLFMVISVFFLVSSNLASGATIPAPQTEEEKAEAEAEAYAKLFKSGLKSWPKYDQYKSIVCVLEEHHALPVEIQEYTCRQSWLKEGIDRLLHGRIWQFASLFEKIEKMYGEKSRSGVLKINDRIFDDQSIQLEVLKYYEPWFRAKKITFTRPPKDMLDLSDQMSKAFDKVKKEYMNKSKNPGVGEVSKFYPDKKMLFIYPAYLVSGPNYEQHLTSEKRLELGFRKIIHDMVVKSLGFRDYLHKRQELLRIPDRTSSQGIIFPGRCKSSTGTAPKTTPPPLPVDWFIQGWGEGIGTNTVHGCPRGYTEQELWGSEAPTTHRP